MSRFPVFKALDDATNPLNAASSGNAAKASQDNRFYDVFNSDFFKRQMAALDVATIKVVKKDNAIFIAHLDAESKVRQSLDQSSAFTPGSR